MTIVSDPPVAAAHHAAAGESVIKPGYHPRLTNEDLAPLREQKWKAYNYFAFWMSDVHSVGGYLTAGSLFALGLVAWQVLVALLVGITIVYLLCNLVSQPSQATGTPYPVISRVSFGVLGANIPAIIRGLIAVAWYGIQTYLASHAFLVLALKLWPAQLGKYAQVEQYGFLGLSALGWAAFLLMWVLQAVVFWNGMEAIRRFIDFCGPAVYLVMFALAGYLVTKAGWGSISFNLNPDGLTVTGWAAVGVMVSAIALVVSYFSGPMLNYGDFARYGSSMKAIRTGNLLGLPVNFLVFSVVVVVTAAATIPVYGRLITDPVETVAQLDSVTAVLLGAVTFAVATIGINIIANFVSPAFDFSNVNPQRISWRMGGFIAAVGAVLITPWNLYNSPETIHYTLNTLGAFIGPLYGVLIADYFLVKRRQVNVDDLYSMEPTGRYWYQKGYNLAAVAATAVAATAAVLPVFLTDLSNPDAGWGTVAKFSWFVGAGLGMAVYLVLARATRWVGN